MQRQFIPVLTSAAGSCLTVANWQDCGISIGAFYLDALLMKPGLAVLNRANSLANYYNWPGQVVLNVNLPTPNKEGTYRLRSHYDGELITLDNQVLQTVISTLKPDFVFLSAVLNASDLTLPATIKILSTSDYQFEEGEGLWFESDKPAADAIAGRVYNGKQTIELLDSVYSQQFIPLSPSCSCPTCSQGFTCAYLHHLLIHTPLLAQRYLIQHNVFCQQKDWQAR